MIELSDLLNPNLRRLSPDPIRNEIMELKKHGFNPERYPERDFTIGVPAPIPKEIAQIAAKAAYDNELQQKYSYPPFLGNEELIELIIELEKSRETGITHNDKERMCLTTGASGGLEYVFSLIGPNSTILVQSPAWGTTYNFIADSGNIGIPTKFFKEDGEFNRDEIDSYFRYNPKAVYINLLNNPNPKLPKEKAFVEFLSFLKERKLIVVSDDPYIFTMFDKRNIKKYSILNSPEEVKRRSFKIGSFSKVTKPEDRLGYVIIGEELAKNMGNSWKMRLRDYGAGIPSIVQSSVTSILKYDPQLNYLESIVQLYKQNVIAIRELFETLGVKINGDIDGAYFTFVKTPNSTNGKEFAIKLAKETSIGVIPGSSFIPSKAHYNGTSFIDDYKEIINPFEDVLNYIRIGFGGCSSPSSIRSLI